MREKIIAVALSLSILLQLGGCLKNNKTKNSIDALEQIDEIEVEYDFNYSDSFDYNAIKRMENKIKECKFEYSDDYNYFDVYTEMLQNSNLELQMKDITEKEEELQQALLQALINIYSNEDYVNDDYCLLRTVKIRIGKLTEETVLANFEYPSNIITIDYDKIKDDYDYGMYDSTKNNFSFLERLTQVVEHELNHARQYACDCRLLAGQKNYRISIDGMSSNNLIEASAESETYTRDVNNSDKEYSLDEIHTYPVERRNQVLLLMMAMFKPGFMIESYYKAIFSSDLKEFHNLFDLKTEEDYENFYRIFIALNLLDGNYNFNDAEKESSEIVGNDYKIDIFKIVVKDLITKINDENLELSDSLNLYSIIKSVIILNEMKLDENNEKYYDEEFLEKIGKINEIFYAFICNRFGISQNKLEEFIYDYSFVIESQLLFNYFEECLVTEDEECKHLYEFINKFPIIKELLFCYNNVWYFNNEIFDNEYRLLKEKKQ